MLRCAICERYPCTCHEFAASTPGTFGDEVNDLNYSEATLFQFNEERIRIARESGLEVVFADDRTLQLDLDTKDAYYLFRNQQDILGEERLGTEGDFIIEPSKSGLPKRHVTIKLKEPADIWKRIALQCLLGSDLKREALNAARVLEGVPDPICFFEKKAATMTTTQSNLGEIPR